MEDPKKIVKEKYGDIARNFRPVTLSSCGCSTGCCSESGYTLFSEEYSTLQGYVPEADLGLGCGIPTLFAGIKKGDTVVDLGSGAGNDCFIARSQTGENGKVIGIDMTPEMVERAKNNARKYGFPNVDFLLGEIENIPLPENFADVVISNCVLNLVPDKYTAFREIFRILKTGGHITASDIVLSGELPEPLRRNAEMYAGCVSGAIEEELYFDLLNKAGFENIAVLKKVQVNLPDELLQEVLTNIELERYRLSGAGIFSITFRAEKPR